MYKFLDVSKHQSTFSPITAVNAGIQGVILRLCYSTTVDYKLNVFAPAAKAAGLIVGGYGFSTWHYAEVNKGDINTARLKMRAQINALIGYAKQYSIDSWICIDQELESGYSMGLTPQQNSMLLMEACSMIESAGFSPCVYASASWISARIDLSIFTYPVWAAYYYADPNDPDFSGCKTLEQISTNWAKYLVSLGTKLCGWQYGRIGYGSKYGVGSQNVDRDWFYYMPKEERPVFNSDTLKIGPASAGDIKALMNLADSLFVDWEQDSDYLIIGPMSSGDIATISNKAISLGLNCVDYYPDDSTDSGSTISGDSESIAKILKIVTEMQESITEIENAMHTKIDALIAAKRSSAMAVIEELEDVDSGY